MNKFEIFWFISFFISIGLIFVNPNYWIFSFVLLIIGFILAKNHKDPFN